MNFLTDDPPIKLSKFIADTEYIHYLYPRRLMDVKPKSQKEVNLENLSSCNNLDRLPRGKLEKKIPSGPIGGSLTNFALISKEKI